MQPVKLHPAWIWRTGLVLLGATTALAPEAADSGFAGRLTQGKRPALTVVISIDQFRADYLTRFADLFLPARQSSGSVGVSVI
jgi:hypothetical protein